MGIGILYHQGLTEVVLGTKELTPLVLERGFSPASKDPVAPDPQLSSAFSLVSVWQMMSTD